MPRINWFNWRSRKPVSENFSFRITWLCWILQASSLPHLVINTRQTPLFWITFQKILWNKWWCWPGSIIYREVTTLEVYRSHETSDYSRLLNQLFLLFSNIDHLPFNVEESVAVSVHYRRDGQFSCFAAHRNFIRTFPLF